MLGLEYLARQSQYSLVDLCSVSRCLNLSMIEQTSMTEVAVCLCLHSIDYEDIR